MYKEQRKWLTEEQFFGVFGYGYLLVNFVPILEGYNWGETETTHDRFGSLLIEVGNVSAWRWFHLYVSAFWLIFGYHLAFSVKVFFEYKLLGLIKCGSF